MKVNYIRIHVYEYTERMFASNLPYRDRKPKYMSKSLKKHIGDSAMNPRCVLHILGNPNLFAGISMQYLLGIPLEMELLYREKEFVQGACQESRN